jgi:serine/threonine protein kinase
MLHSQDRSGEYVGDYRLLHRRGWGTFGEVYQAEDRRSHHTVAVKLLKMPLTHREDLKAFLNEARAFRLHHPHIVPLLDFGLSEHDLPFLVMEYVAGGTLRDRYPKGSKVPLDVVVDLTSQLASALQYAHDQHLVHRDVKPENMLCRVDGTVLLSDFGIASVAHASSSLSVYEGVGGTLAYMAPEQIEGKPRRESDQYSLAVVVYEWLAGVRPFQGTVPELISQHLHTPPRSLLDQVPTLPVDVEQVVFKALAKRSQERFASMLAFATAFEQASLVTQLEAEPEPVLPVSQTTETNQSQQPTEIATPGPEIPLSQQIVDEVSADIPPQPQTPIPSSDKERLPQAEAERPQTEGERAPQEQEHADKLEAERIRQAQEAETTQKAEDERAHKARGEEQARKTAAASPSASNGLTQPAQEPEVTPSFPTPAAHVSNGKDAAPPPTSSAEIRTASQDHAEELTPPLHTASPMSSWRRSPGRVLLLVILSALLIGSGSLVYVNVRQNQDTATANATATSRAQANATSTAQANGTATVQAQLNATATVEASIPGRIWHTQHSGTTQDLFGVAWSGSQFVAVGIDTILTSPNGHTWTAQNTGTNQYLYGVTWSGSQFVAVGGFYLGGAILTSPDGRAWTAQHYDTGGTAQALRGVAWSGSQFVAVGTNGTILTSPNGRTWTTQHSGTSGHLQDVAWSGSQFVAVGDTIVTSPDGHAWTAQHSGTSQVLLGVAGSGLQFVVVGDGGTILTSP